MSYYSIDLMLPASLEKKESDVIMKNIGDIVKTNDGKILSTSDSVKKKLSYEIKGADLVNMINVSVSLEPEVIEKVKASLGQIPAILRSLILKLKKEPTKETAKRVSKPAAKKKTVKKAAKTVKKPSKIIKTAKAKVKKEVIGKTSKTEKKSKEPTDSERNKLLDEKLDELLKD